MTGDKAKFSGDILMSGPTTDYPKPVEELLNGDKKIVRVILVHEDLNSDSGREDYFWVYDKIKS